MQHAFFLCVTAFQALRLTVFLAQYLGPCASGMDRLRAQIIVGEEAIGAPRGWVTCYGTQRREGCFGRGVEAKDSWTRCTLLLGLEGRET